MSRGQFESQPYPVGTQVVVTKPIQDNSGGVSHPAGAVGVVVRSPQDPRYAYRIRFLDGLEAAIHHAQLVLLGQFKDGDIGRGAATGDDSHEAVVQHPLFDRVVLKCVIGSRAYGLDDDQSDTDRRGVYLPPAESQWSLYGVPAQLENEETQEVYWELQKFIILALKANPNVLECLYSPLVEKATPLAEELLGMRQCFLSKLVFQTYSGYVASQFKKMQTDIRNHGRVKWKHVMHLIRLLLSGIYVLREGEIAVAVPEHRERLLEIKSGQASWDEVETWRQELHTAFSDAFQNTALPARPDYERANEFLIQARKAALASDLP